MPQIGSYEAKTHLPRILSRVLAGETFVVTRNGEPIAQIGPVKKTATVKSPKDALKKLRALRIRLGDEADVKTMRDEGRR
jgi:antitoxin (DNA-binding transcriptional repressor) of toxin-antitoxin stability system